LSTVNLSGGRDDDFERFVRRVRERFAIDLGQYKEQQMKRRLTTLRLRRGFSSFDDYFEAIVRDADLRREFLDRMTINVSEFWRNRVRWERLRDRFIPELLRQTRQLKCWSAACSTGEEPYTLAMILDEMGVLAGSTLLATDIDEKALDKAKEGVYHERSLREVPEIYIARYFRRVGDEYAVSDKLKRHVRFVRHDLLVDPFDSRFDLIICRNVLIYFTEPAKERLYAKFAAALKPGGILFVGSTEQIFQARRYGFEPVENFFYRKEREPQA